MAEHSRATSSGVSAKDIALAIVGPSDRGGAGHVIEYRGERYVTSHGRSDDVCNMASRRCAAGSSPLTTRPMIPGTRRASPGRRVETAAQRWRTFVSDDDGEFDSEIVLHAEDIVLRSRGARNRPRSFPSMAQSRRPRDGRSRQNRRPSAPRLYGLTRVRRAIDSIDVVFIGSCTNSRIETCAGGFACAGTPRRRGLRALVVPGSHPRQTTGEDEGLTNFLDAGRMARTRCSMCLGMNPDQLVPRCAARHLDRNFEGPGRGGRTHLVSPGSPAASAVMGRFASPEELS